MIEPSGNPATSLATPAARPGLLDRAAILLSGLCLVHCVATLLFVTLLASAGSFFLADPRIHEYGLGIAIALASVALLRGVIQHRRLLPIGLGAVGLSLMASGLIVEHGVGEAAFTIVGVLLVASAHRLNTRGRIA
jgi:hypothetical protein